MSPLLNSYKKQGQPKPYYDLVCPRKLRSIFFRTFQPYELLQSLRQQQRSYQPLGCYLHQSDPSSLREPVRKKNLRTVHQSAYVLMYQSYHKKRDLQPCYRDAVYVRYHRRMQLRSTSCPARCTPSCKYLQRDAGNV